MGKITNKPIKNNKFKKSPTNKKLQKKQVVDVVREKADIPVYADNNGYDSMIENGKSEDSDSSQCNDNDNESSDDLSEEESSADVNDKDTHETNTKKRKAMDNTSSQMNNASPIAKKSKKPIGEKIKPPTLEEINELKETRNLFHSNLFRLQVKEMLTELQIKDKYIKYINNWLEQFKAFVNAIKSAPSKEDCDKMQWLQKCSLKVPFSMERLGVKRQKTFQFQFIKSTNDPYLIGAAATQTLLGPRLIADVCLPIPADCFQKENYLNLVYDQKRAYYLTYIANAMLKSEQFKELTVNNLKFNYYANNPLKPVLEIQPPQSMTKIVPKLTIRLFVAAEENSFKLSRFVPWNSNIRGSIFEDENDNTDEGHDNENDQCAPLATPNYNANVLFDLTMQRNQHALDEVFKGNINLQHGLVLLKVWLRQRQLNAGFSGIHSHMLAMYMVYLFRQRKLHTNMSSYQVARTVWNQLAHSTWDEDGKGITLCATSAVASQPTLEQFHTYYDVVFIDCTGFYNICANISLEIYRRTRMESRMAVDMLNDMKLNSFQLIFMHKFPLYTQFDHILKIDKRDTVEQILEMHVPPADKCNYAGYAYPQLLKNITKILRKGLGERVHALLPIEQPIESWSCIAHAPNDGAGYLHVGIILNAEHAFEILDKGPETIAENADEFRKFWGDKAKLRRFQDGTITESVLWADNKDPLRAKRLIVRSIVMHLLQHHFQLDVDAVNYIAGEFDVLYKLTPAYKVDKLHEKLQVSQDTDAEQLSLRVIRCFDDLARKLHNLSDLPLEIVSIAGISPVFRYCEPSPILPEDRCIQGQLFAMHVHHGVMQLGLSGKWPDELVAMRALKTAFYIEIAKLLREKHNLHTQVTYDGVVVLKQNYCFALEIAHPKEVALLKREKTEKGITRYVDSADSIALEKRHYVLPKVSGTLHALYQSHPSYGSTVMIAKRWLYTQLIDNGIWPDECTELLVASQFLKTSAQQISCSPQTGFIRFLQLLAFTDWQTELFLLNFNNAMEETEISDLEQRFAEARDTFPPLCIVTAYDQKHYGTLWATADKPNVHVLARVTILARQALGIIETLLLGVGTYIKPSNIFIPSNEGYDLVIQLKPDMVPNTRAFEFGSPFVAFTKPNWRLPLAGTNFLHDAVEKLREAYSEFAAFFYNPCGGKEIAIIWKPSHIFAEREFKVTDVNGCSLSASDNTKVQCRKEVLIEDFKFILKDFYLRIDTVDEVLKASRVKTATEGRYFDKPIIASANEDTTKPKTKKKKQPTLQLNLQKDSTKRNPKVATKLKQNRKGKLKQTKSDKITNGKLKVKQSKKIDNELKFQKSTKIGGVSKNVAITVVKKKKPKIKNA